MEFVAVGVDLGQKRDPSAVVVAQQDDQDPPTYSIRFMARMPLGTAYPAVAKRVAEVTRGAWQAINGPVQTGDGSIVRSWRHGPITPLVIVDATGVGRPVVEILKGELNRLTEEPPVSPRAPYFSYELIAATFTHGDRLAWVEGEQRVGKAYLVSRLQALLQTSRLKLPRNHHEAEAMARELLDYEIKVDQNANDTYGAFKVGTHDDLVTALGLAVLEDRQMRVSMIFDRDGRRIA